MCKALVAGGGVVFSWNWKQLSSQEPEGGTARQSPDPRGPIDHVAHSRLHAPGDPEVPKQ